MFDYNAAEKAVLEVLEKAHHQLEVELFISEVIEQDFGWVFLYESSDSTTTANATLVFDKTDGVVYIPGSATNVASSVEQYRRGIRTPAQ
jgi:hypothetical protein